MSDLDDLATGAGGSTTRSRKPANPRQTPTLQNWIAIASAVGILVVLVTFVDVRKPPPPQVSPLATTASQMLDEYAGDEFSADAQFRGRLVEVSGTIRWIGRTSANTAYVDLGYALRAVQCLFDRQNERQITSLVRGGAIHGCRRCGGFFR